MQISKEELQGIIETCNNDPLFFIENILGWKPWAKQREIIEAFRTERRITIKSGHGVGKTKLMAGLILQYLFTRPDTMVVTTAPSWTLVETVLWGQIRSQYHNALCPEVLGGTVLNTAIKTLDDNHFAIGISSDEPERVSGFHNKNVLVVVDEASGVEDRMLDALEGLLTQQNSKLVFIGNPINTSNKFYKSFYDPEYSSLFKKITISCYDSPNVKTGNELIPGLVSLRYVEDFKKQFGENSSIFRSRVLGEFPLESEDQLIPTHYIEQSMVRDFEPHYRDPLILAIDVSRYGEDENVFLLRRGNKEILKEKMSGKSLNEVIGKAIVLINEHEPDCTVVDDIGVGGGVTDALSKKYYVLGFTGNEKSGDDLFINIRAEFYWKLKEKFINNKISLIKDGDMAAELSKIIVEYTENGKIKIQSKKDMKKSPNNSDALMMSEYGLSAMNFRESNNRLPQIWMPGIYNSSVTSINSVNNNSNKWGVNRTGY